MNKERKLNIFKSIKYIAAIIIFALTIGISYSYWASDILTPNDESIDVNIQVGEWFIDPVAITVDNNHGDFLPFTILVERGEALGQIRYDNYFDFDVLPKDHIGVDKDEYTFDDWYFNNGTKFSHSSVINDDITIYPSWNTSLFKYTLSSGKYNVTKPDDINYSGDLYIPGWRYRGRMIRSIDGMSGVDVLSLSIGDGFEKILYEAFKEVTATSLYLGEGIIEIGQRAFLLSNIPGGLVIPSTVETILSRAFMSSAFDGNLDLTNATSLTTIGEYAFWSTPFTGDLYFGPSVKSIGPTSFSLTGFNGTLDLSEATSLTTISSYAFNSVKFVGEVYIPENVTTIGANAFANGHLDTINLEDASSLITIGGYAFVNSRLETIIFPINGSLEEIGTQAFQNTNLSGYLIFPPTIKIIRGVSFSGTTINQIFIPISVEEITGNFLPGKNVLIKYEGASIPPEWAPTWNNYNNQVLFNQVP